MKFARAQSVGKQGEHEVSAILRAFARSRECAVLDDVRLVGRRERPTQIDHLLVDRYGVLIVETKVRTGAYLKGTDYDDKWTACYPAGNKVFDNPLIQNRYHEKILRESLKLRGCPIDPDYVSGAVVFVGGTNIEGLDLDSLSRARVTTLECLPSQLERRADFAINRGVLSPDEIDLYAAAIDRLRMARVA